MSDRLARALFTLVIAAAATVHFAAVLWLSDFLVDNHWDSAIAIPLCVGYALGPPAAVIAYFADP